MVILDTGCQTGNFDLYLPFIERSLELLNRRGRLGFIAPSLWRYNEYGEGLRELLHDGGHLDRWIDFGSFQVFDEAIIYTALQFYSKRKNDRVRFALAPTGEVARIHDWDDQDWYVKYDELPRKDAWMLVPRNERALIKRLETICRRLDDRRVTRAIYQGLITSADHIFHLDQASIGRYVYRPLKSEGGEKKPAEQEVQLEDSIMHPLVSGKEANRYEIPQTSTYILFPYEVKNGSVRLFTESEMTAKFPHAWKHLKRFEQELRRREDGKFDDNEWYRFGRHQNIDKQAIRKILVPRLCVDLAAVNDREGVFYIDNVDVGGIELADGMNPDFVVGLLNSSTINFIWKRIAKPFQNGYRSANKQFIAPLPIPTTEHGEDIARLAVKLGELHSGRRDVVREIERRFKACDRQDRSEAWVWPGVVGEIVDLLEEAPAELSRSAKSFWAGKKRARQIELASARLDEQQLRNVQRLEPELSKGELRLTANGAVVLDSVFVDPKEGEQTLVSWRHFLRMTSRRERLRAADLIKILRTVYFTKNPALEKQIFDLDAEISRLDLDIAKYENELNLLAYRAYELTSDEISLIEKG